jgi:hypothetical protein
LEEYRYTVSVLRDIARCYDRIYEDGLTLTHRGWVYHIEYNPFRLAEYKADFDIALKKLPRRLRKAVRNDIKGGVMDGYEAYSQMAKFLNGELT